MSDLELVIRRSKQLESLLEEGFGATGRGLHEKVTSVEGKLPPPLVKKLRFIATVRNKLVHDAKLDRLDDRKGFERACNDAEKQLKALLAPAKSGRWGCGILAIIVGILALVAAALLSLIIRL
jgi:hypothetical protein